MICCDYLNTAASPLKQIISSWAIMLIEESNLSKQSACCWPTKSNTLKTSLFFVVTMNVQASIVYMDSMTNVSVAGNVCGCGCVDGCRSNALIFIGKRRYNIKLWKIFTDCFNCLPIAAVIDEKIMCMHGGLSPDLQTMEQIRRVMRPTDVPDTGKESSTELSLSTTSLTCESLLRFIV